MHFIVGFGAGVDWATRAVDLDRRNEVEGHPSNSNGWHPIARHRMPDSTCKPELAPPSILPARLLVRICSVAYGDGLVIVFETSLPLASL